MSNETGAQFFSFGLSVSALLALFLSYLIVSLWKKWNQNLPPGPWGLPVVGYAPFLGARHYETFSNLAKKYGSVLSIDVLGTNVVVLNSYEAIRECFLTQGDQFSGRVASNKAFSYWIVNGKGIAQDEGRSWVEHRRFTLHTLRDFGFGKLSMEERIHEIGKDLLTSLKASGGKPYDPINLLSSSTMSVILFLAGNKKYSSDDKEFLNLHKSVTTALEAFRGILVFIVPPWKKYLPLSWNFGYSKLFQAKEHLHCMTRKLIEEHLESFDENCMRDLIDVFLKERNTAQKEGKLLESTFTVDRLNSILLNFVVGGTETTSNTIYYAIRIVSQRPDIQERLHKELDDVVGRERFPSILDRPSLPYVEAFILELLRYSTVTPTGLPHTNPASCQLFGYNIPARSLIVANYWAVHNNPQVFPDPHLFDPERFLDGPLKNKRRERVLTFSIGKRSCLGESLARMELFLFLTMMLQRFSFRPQEGQKINGETEHFIRVPNPYRICAIPRYN